MKYAILLAIFLIQGNVVFADEIPTIECAQEGTTNQIKVKIFDAQQKMEVVYVRLRLPYFDEKLRSYFMITGVSTGLS